MSSRRYIRPTRFCVTYVPTSYDDRNALITSGDNLCEGRLNEMGQVVNCMFIIPKGRKSKLALLMSEAVDGSW